MAVQPPDIEWLRLAHLDISLNLISKPLCHMERLVMTVPMSLVAPARRAGKREGGEGRGKGRGRKKEGEETSIK